VTSKLDASFVLSQVETAPRAASTTRRPRIVLVQTQAEGAGAQEITRILGLELAARGFEVHHLFFFRRTSAFDGQPNTHFCALERPSNVRSLLGMLGDLVKTMRSLAPDVVLTFQHYGNLLGAVAGRLAGATVIANRVSARALEPRWTRAADFLFGFSGVFDRLVVNSKSVGDEYTSYPRRYRKRIVRIDHGFQPKRSDASGDQARRSLGLPADAPLLGSVARLHPEKNLTAAIRLLVVRPDWHLALAGQGEDRERLEALAHKLKVSARVHFTGELSPDGVALFLKALDVFVFPTRMETFGLAAVEAAQAGVPVAANDIAVLREVLRVNEEPCALFVNADNTEAFALAVDRLLDDPDLRSTLIASSRGLERRYALKTMTDRYNDLLARAMHDRTRNGRRQRPTSAH
jgi:glycosyltransferase involved in cell wall biosynthesis